jgi:antitoxin MazE
MYLPSENTPGGEKAMIKTLTKHGNSWALVIDKPVLELLNIDPTTPLKLSTDGQTLIITPAPETAPKKKFREALSETNRRYGKALKRLSQ